MVATAVRKVRNVSQPLCHITFQLRVELRDVTPKVWRKVLVPTSVRLDRLADMLLAAMGWTNSHLHCFEVRETRYGVQFDEYPEGEVDETSVTVLAALRDVGRFEFEYDFGDGWTHDVDVEARLESTLGLKHAVCVDGANACPPEDCGGPSGFEYFLEVLTDPTHEEHENYVRWNGGATFDRSAFDLVSANAALQKVRSRSTMARH
jgi:Plasmid pRiA4b ORF-3-like protein